MKNNILGELIVSVALIGLSFSLLDPFDLSMTQPVHMSILVVGAIVFAFFVAYVWKEHPHDEREYINRNIAGRAGYLAGVGVLLLGIAIESFRHSIDIWLVAALVIMILVKVISQVYRNIIN